MFDEFDPDYVAEQTYFERYQEAMEYDGPPEEEPRAVYDPD